MRKRRAGTQIICALIRNPGSDNKIGALTGVPVRTVSRKRAAWSRRHPPYYTVDAGTAPPAAQHMIIIVQAGVTRSQLVRRSPAAQRRQCLRELIRDSYMAETDGHIALVMVLEGESDSDVAENLQGKIVPSLKKNHGQDSIVELRTIRLLGSIRREHNYLPMVNMQNGVLRDDWPDEAIFVE